MKPRYPAPPPGRGPALVTCSRRLDGLVVGFFWALSLMAFYIVWADSPDLAVWFSPTLFWPPVVCAIVDRRMGLALGEDWFDAGHGFVDTSSLADVGLCERRADSGNSFPSWDLRLRDHKGREVTVDFELAKENPELWELLRARIMHAIQKGAARANKNMWWVTGSLREGRGRTSAFD